MAPGGFGVGIRVVEVVRGYSKFMSIHASTSLGRAATPSIISITILLMAMISVRGGLLLHGGARPRVLPTTPACELHAPIVVGLQARLLIEGVLEAHPVVGDEGLLRR